MKVKIVRNVPEEKRLKEQERLEKECEALTQKTIRETEKFLEEYNRYQTVVCPACGEVVNIDTHKSEELMSEKHGTFISRYVYAKTAKCSACKSVISFDERKKTELDTEEIWSAFGLLLVALFLIVFPVVAAIGVYNDPNFDGIVDTLNAMLDDAGAEQVEFTNDQENQKVFSVTVTGAEQDAQGFRYELTDSEGMTIIVFSEIDQRYEVGKDIYILAQYKVDGTKIFSENGNSNSWRYVMNSNSKE